MLLTSPDHLRPLDYVDRFRRLEFLTDPERLRLLNVFWTYYTETRRLGIHTSWTISQALLEADYGRSPVSRFHHNWAGIKNGPTAGNAAGEYRSYPTDVDGARDHVHLLATYAGVHVPNQIDPTRLTRIPAALEDALGRPRAVFSYDLNGIWAVPGSRYGENVDAVWLRVFGS